MNYPCLQINLKKLKSNCEIINDRCTKLGISVVGVLKCVLGNKKIARIYKECGIEIFGDSRIENLIKLRNYFGKNQQLMLLRTPMISEAQQVVKICQVSLNTQIDTIKALSSAAKKLGVNHKIIVMVETDDKREGLLPQQVHSFCEYVVKNCPNIIIWGIGTNARCISKQSPRLESIDLLIKLKRGVEEKLKIQIPIISGGNSSIWTFIENRQIKSKINQIRIGEAILLGHETLNYQKINGAFDDAFILKAEIIEVKKNLNININQNLNKTNKLFLKNGFDNGYDKKDNSFYINNSDSGAISKIIVALGVQDVGYKNIFCVDPKLEIIDQSSDHTVIAVKGMDLSGSGNNIENAKVSFKPGDIINFRLNYFGLLSAMTSPFVKKRWIN